MFVYFLLNMFQLDPAGKPSLDKLSKACWKKNNMDVSENSVRTPTPNGFADHYPGFRWLFHWEYTQHFQTNPYIIGSICGVSSGNLT